MEARRAATTLGLLAAGLLVSCVGAADTPTPALPAASPTSSPFPAVLPTSSPAVLPSPAVETYVVASGDTFSGIAGWFGVTVDALLAMNPSIRDPNRVAVGEVISVPVRSVGTVIRIEGPDYRHLRLGEMAALVAVGSPQLANETIHWQIAEAGAEPTAWGPGQQWRFLDEPGFDASGRSTTLAEVLFGHLEGRHKWQAYRAWVDATVAHPELWTQVVVVEWGGSGPCPAAKVEGLDPPVVAPDGTTYELAPGMDDEYNSQWSIVASAIGGTPGTGWRHELEPCWEPGRPGVVAGSDATAYTTWWYRVGGKPAEMVVVGPEGVRTRAPIPGSIERAPDGTVFAIRREVNDEGHNEPTFRSMTVAALGPDGDPRPGWPFTTTDPTSWPVYGPDGTVYLAQTTEPGDRILALGLDGKVRHGWPYAVPGELEWTACGAGCANVPESPGVAPDGSVVFNLDAGIYLIRPDGSVKGGWPYLLPEGTSIAMPAPVDTPSAGPFRAVITDDGRIYMPRADGRYADYHQDMMCLRLDGSLCPGWPVKLPDGTSVQGFSVDDSGIVHLELIELRGEGYSSLDIRPDGTIIE